MPLLWKIHQLENVGPYTAIYYQQSQLKIIRMSITEGRIIAIYFLTFTVSPSTHNENAVKRRSKETMQWRQ